MRKINSARTAGMTSLIILTMLLIFHVLVLSDVFPADIIWGGQLESDSSNTVVLELVALLVTALFMSIVVIKIYYTRPGILKTLINIAIWLMVVYFIFNTVGNILSPGALENYVFAPLTVLLGLLLLRLGLER